MEIIAENYFKFKNDEQKSKANVLESGIGGVYDFKR